MQSQGHFKIQKYYWSNANLHLRQFKIYQSCGSISCVISSCRRDSKVVGEFLNINYRMSRLMNILLRSSRSLLNKNNDFTIPRAAMHIFIKRNYAATRKRFYRRTGILCNDGKYEITLDQRKLKTPNGNLFTVESEPLALAVAAEWDAQKSKIEQSSMYFSLLCNTTIDNPNNLTKYDMVQYIVNYLDTDTVLYHTNDHEELYKLQIEEWDPVIQWFCNRFEVKLEKSKNMNTPTINDEVKAVISRHLMSYNIACVHGFVYGVDALKSVILTLACAERFLSPEKATLLSRLEEEFQLGKWGRIEWAHDLHQQDLQARLSATILFIYFNSSSWLRKTKIIA